MSSLSIAPDTVVTLTYVLFNEHGDAVDGTTTGEPLTYVHGYAQIVPGLERALEGLRPGERRSVVVGPDEAFGEHDQEGVFEVDKSDFPESNEVEVGDEFMAEGPEGEPIALRVIEILPDAFRVDTNHPLAGQTVRFEVEVTDVRAASDDEIAQAQAELEECIEHEHEHEHDGCCDHGAHDGHGSVSAEQLLKLSKKP